MVIALDDAPWTRAFCCEELLIPTIYQLRVQSSISFTSHFGDTSQTRNKTMFPRWNRLWALLCLFLAIQLATAQSFRLVVRDDQSSTAIHSDSESKTATQQSDATKTANSEKSTDTSESDNTSDATASATSTKTKASKSVESTASSTVISSNGDLDNSTFVNGTVIELPHTRPFG